MSQSSEKTELPRKQGNNGKCLSRQNHQGLPCQAHLGTTSMSGHHFQKQAPFVGGSMSLWGFAQSSRRSWGLTPSRKFSCFPRLGLELPGPPRTPNITSILTASLEATGSQHE